MPRLMWCWQITAGARPEHCPARPPHLYREIVTKAPIFFQSRVSIGAVGQKVRGMVVGIPMMMMVVVVVMGLKAKFTADKDQV